MASSSRRSLRERVLAVCGGKRPARHSCSSFNELQQAQRMDETGFTVPVASPNSSLQSSTLPSTSRPLRLTALGWEQVQLPDKAKPQKSNSLGSFHLCTPGATMRPFSRFQETLVAHSELDRFPQMQMPTTESKNSSVRYKTKKTAGMNTSVPNESTEEIFSQMDTLCSEANRSSQMFDSSAGILDGNSESTTPLTSGQSSKGLIEDDAEHSPARKTSGVQRSVGMETDALYGQNEDADVDSRDLQLSHGAKTIIKTADAVIKIFDGSLSIKGRFKEIVVQMNEKKGPRNIVNVATNTDACHTQHESALPHFATCSVQTDNYVDVGVANSLTESCVPSEAPGVHIEDTPSVQTELRRLKYKLLNSDDDDDESVKELDKNGLTAATHCISMILPQVEDNVPGFQPAVVTVSGKTADELAGTDVRDNTVSIVRKDIVCVDNTPGTGCDNGGVFIPDTVCPDCKHELPKNVGERVTPFVDVGSRDGDVPSDNISRSFAGLPCCSTDSPDFVSSCARRMGNVDSSGHSKEHLESLETTNQRGNQYDSEGNAERMCPEYSKHNCDGATDCEDASQLARRHQTPPAVSGEASPADQGSVAVGDRKRAGGESHSEGLDLDDCEISAAADSSTIVDGCSPDSPPAESGTAGQYVCTDGVVADMKMASPEDGSGSSDGSPVDECGLVDVYKLTQQVNHQTGKLNKLFDKYRSRAVKIERLQKYLEQLNKEKEEMCRLLEGVNKETAALRLEAAELRCTVSAVCDSSVTTIGKETEARRLEPTCYRRYTNIRTAADASNALAAVRCRIKALNELEVLVYRKQLMLNHILPSLHQDAAPHTKPALLPSKHLKSKKNEQTSHTRGSRNNVVIEVLSDPNSWSEIQTYTDSALTISTALTTSNDGTASVGAAPGTDV